MGAKPNSGGKGKQNQQQHHRKAREAEYADGRSNKAAEAHDHDTGAQPEHEL